MRRTVSQILETTIRFLETCFRMVDLVSSARDNWDHLRDSGQEGEMDEYYLKLDRIESKYTRNVCFG